MAIAGSNLTGVDTLALARQVAMHLLRQEGLTAERVGQILRRDYSTVLHGDARIRWLVADEAPIRHDLATLRHSVGAA